MTKIIPINSHVEVRPIREERFISSSEKTYEEKGEVLAIAAIPTYEEDCEFRVGDTIYFDSWCVAQYPDSTGEIHYLVPFDKIRAYEPCTTKNPSATLVTGGSTTTDTLENTLEEFSNGATGVTTSNTFPTLPQTMSTSPDTSVPPSSPTTPDLPESIQTLNTNP